MSKLECIKYLQFDTIGPIHLLRLKYVFYITLGGKTSIIPFLSLDVEYPSWTVVCCNKGWILFHSRRLLSNEHESYQFCCREHLPETQEQFMYSVKDFSHEIGFQKKKCKLGKKLYIWLFQYLQRIIVSHFIFVYLQLFRVIVKLMHNQKR